MDPNVFLLLLITIGAIVVLSALFAMVEIAILTIPISKIQAEKDLGNPAATTLMKLKDSLSKMLLHLFSIMDI